MDTRNKKNMATTTALINVALKVVPIALLLGIMLLAMHSQIEIVQAASEIIISLYISIITIFYMFLFISKKVCLVLTPDSNIEKVANILLLMVFIYVGFYLSNYIIIFTAYINIIFKAISERMLKKLK